MAIFDHFETEIGSFWGDFGPFLGRSVITLRSLRDHVGIVLASFWGRFGVVFRYFVTLFRGLLGVRFGLFFDHFWAISAHSWPFLRSFCDFLVVFWEVDGKIKQNDTRERKNMQISAKIHKYYTNLGKKASLFTPINHLFRLKNGQNRHFNI